MGECRNLMPCNLLKEWRGWLDDKDVKVVYKPIPYSPFGAIINGKTYRVYVRDDTHAGGETVHASLHGPLVRLARDFLKDRNQSKGGKS